MKIDAVKFGLAAAYAVVIFWVVCTIVVVLLPGMTMSMSGYMMHADFSGMAWQMGIAGFVAGLMLWSLMAGVFAWLLASIYNRMV